tara:strand:- start:1412 stop:1855 length:444 start_codon:yes stop_codon:yes gene_type:complete
MISLNDLQEMWSIDCKIDDLQLGKESTKTPELHAKYLAHLSTAKLQLRKAEADLYKLKAVKAKYFRGELSREELSNLGWEQYLGIKPLKNDLQDILNADNDVSKQEDKAEYIRTIVDFLERVLRSLNSRSFDIKNSIEWEKFTNGLL